MAASSRIDADYLIETPVDPRMAAETMAGEPSSGTARSRSS
jgi:ribulose-bisphosphate carboxylase large chain